MVTTPQASQVRTSRCGLLPFPQPRYRVLAGPDSQPQALDIPQRWRRTGTQPCSGRRTRSLRGGWGSWTDRRNSLHRISSLPTVQQAESPRINRETPCGQRSSLRSTEAPPAERVQPKSHLVFGSGNPAELAAGTGERRWGRVRPRSRRCRTAHSAVAEASWYRRRSPSPAAGRPRTECPPERRTAASALRVSADSSAVLGESPIERACRKLPSDRGRGVRGPAVRPFPPDRSRSPIASWGKEAVSFGCGCENWLRNGLHRLRCSFILCFSAVRKPSEDTCALLREHRTYRRWSGWLAGIR